MTKTKLLKVRELSARTDNTQILRNVSLDVDAGEVVALVGSNGSGKSSLAMSLMGSSEYEVNSSEMSLDSVDLRSMSVDERSREGLFVAWQNPILIPGLSVFNFLKTAYLNRGKKIESLVEFRTKLEDLGKRVGLSKDHIMRGVNEGYSGGERKRLELLQILLLRPKVVILDEIDSGLDRKGREMVAKVVSELVTGGTGVILISHYEQFYKEVGVSRIFKMKKGEMYEEKRQI